MILVVQRIEVGLYLKTHIKMPARLFNKALIGLDTDTIIAFGGHSHPEFLR